MKSIFNGSQSSKSPFSFLSTGGRKAGLNTSSRATFLTATGPTAAPVNWCYDTGNLTKMSLIHPDLLSDLNVADKMVKSSKTFKS